MNIALTNKCNRRCEFCFQKEWFLESPEHPLQEMPMEMFKDIVAHFRLRECQIFGGEPFLYSKLDELGRFCLEKDLKITLLTNLSVEPAIVKNFFEKYGKIVKGALVNSDYHPHQENDFIANCQYLEDNKFKFALGTTFLPDADRVEENISRMTTILKKVDYDQLNFIRISTMTPKHEGKFKQFDYSQIVGKYIEELLKINPKLRFGFDCVPAACEISPDFWAHYHHVLQDKNYKICTPILDFMTDGSVIWCSSAKFFTVPDYKKFNTLEELKTELLRQRQAYWRRYNLAIGCRECINFGADTCGGLCAAKNEAIRLAQEQEDGGK